MEKNKLLLMKSAVLLLLLGLLTGLYVAAAMTGKIQADVRMTLGAHMNAFLGAFILFGLAFSLPYLRYGEIGISRLAWATIVANYANWFITGVKALLNVHGVDFIGSMTNDIVFVFLSLFVVLPSLGGTFFWFIGFKKNSQTPTLE